MLWKKLRTLVAQQWVGMIALFLVLATGTAYALPGANTVFSDDIVNAEVTAADIGSGAVASDEIKTPPSWPPMWPPTRWAGERSPTAA